MISRILCRALTGHKPILSLAAHKRGRCTVRKTCACGHRSSDQSFEGRYPLPRKKP